MIYFKSFSGRESSKTRFINTKNRLYDDLKEIDTHITQARAELKKVKTTDRDENRKIEYRIYEIGVIQEINRRIVLILDVSNKTNHIIN